MHKHIKAALLYMMLTAGLVLTWVESSFLGDVYCYIGSIVTSVSILLLCMKRDAMKMPDWLASFGRNYSTYVFILHCGVRDSLKLMVTGNPWLMPWVIMGISIGIGVVCRKIMMRLNH